MNETKTGKRIYRLVLSAMLIALGTACSLVSIGLPLGGSVTLAAMVPLVIISQLYGFRWGAVCCGVYGLLQMILGLDNFSYVTTIWAYIAVALFDYIVAYGVMSLSALTKGMKRPAVRAGVGAFIGCLARFVCHFINGAFVWGEWADVSALPAALQDTAIAKGGALIYSYSFFYNLSYMLPETIITVIVAAAVMGIVEKIVNKDK